MDNGVPVTVALVETLLTTRPGYSVSEDCPQTQEIADAAASGMPLSKIEETFEHVQTCALCRESLQIFMDIDNASDVSASYSVPLPPPSRRGHVILMALAAILLAGFVGGIGLHVWQSQTRQPTEMTMTPKGAVFDLEIAVNRNGVGFPLEYGDMVETGDHLGFFYTATQSAYLTLFHITAQRELSTLFPVRQQFSAFVHDGARVPIEDGAVVTPATSCEWIAGVFTDKQMSIHTLRMHLMKSIDISDRSGHCDLHINNRSDMTIRIQQIRR